jgi:2-polyprenyl-6-methoxyphenol hydroxylase-like FAD-dependent oxidoreductase
MAEKPGQFLEGKRVVVVGGGIAGSSFVTALNKLWDLSLKRPEVIVVDQQSREAFIESEPYVLSLYGGSQDEGLVALQQLGLLDIIDAHSTRNGGTIRVWSDKGKQLATIEHTPYGSFPIATMRIARQDLKRILLKEAEKTNAVWKWACTCTSVERLSNGQVRVNTLDVHTGQSSTEDCDLLVAADGADSGVRATLRPDDMKLEYAGANQIGGISRLPDGIPRPIHEDFGLQMSSGEGVCCIYTPFDKESIGWALSRRDNERKPKSGQFTVEEFDLLKAEAVKAGEMFSEPFKTIIEATDPTTVFVRPAKERKPVSPHLSSQEVVFIGDSNRVLNCFELSGANLALKDGWDLAEQICGNFSINKAVAEFDKLSIPRAEHLYEWSHERIRFGHSSGLLWKMYKYGMTAQRWAAKN